MSSETQKTLSKLHQGAVEARDRARQGDLIADITIRDRNVVLSSSTQKIVKDPVVKWTENMVRFISFQTTEDIIRWQMSLDNPPQQILFDESPVLPPIKQRKSIDVLFDIGHNVREVMNLLEQAASQRIPNTTWGWKAVAGPNSVQGDLTRAVASSTAPVRLNFGDRLYMIPTAVHGDPDPTYQNILYMRGQSTNAAGKKRRQSKSRRTTGYYGLTTRAVRTKARGMGVHVKAVHSFKYAGPFRKIPDGASIGQWSTNKSGKSVFYQGTWAFSLMTMRGARRVNRRR